MNRTQPIRKPKNHLKYELNQHRRLARAINSRIFQKRGKLYLVSRAPALATLEVPFAKLTLKSFVDDEMLSEIAFAGTCDGQLVAQMSPRERRLIRQTIATWQRHGGEKYKLHLPFNEGWIRKARKKNVKLQRWLCPTPYSMFLDNHLVTLRAVANPLEIYFMGTYFNTCLGQGGCNEMSVLANAAHVNKQVIYAYGEDGTVIGRQLIAINSDFQLVGFHNYVNCDGVIKADYEEIVTHFARFARRIARESNIQLPTDDPAPTVENLGGHFWYDDGIHPWHAAIREA